MIAGYCATMPLVRKAVTLSSCQGARSLRRTMAILVSNMHENSRRGIEKHDQVTAAAGTGLVRSCATDGDELIRMAASSRGIERIEARFHGNGFSPHRHDTYALGITIAGVQTFSYRGSSRFSLPGRVIVLHPDEMHDGAAGTEDGLVYRMLYLPPGLIAATAGATEGALPFVAEPVIDDPTLRRALADLLEDLVHEPRSEEHTSELQSLMRISYAVFCL